jgi:hypothetical protein
MLAVGEVIARFTRAFCVAGLHEVKKSAFSIFLSYREEPFVGGQRTAMSVRALTVVTAGAAKAPVARMATEKTETRIVMVGRIQGKVWSLSVERRMQFDLAFKAMGQL